MTGEEITKAIAEKVMAWELKLSHSLDGGQYYAWFEGDRQVSSLGRFVPLHSDSDALDVLDKMAESGWDYNLVKRWQPTEPPYIGCYFEEQGRPPKAYAHFELPASPDARRRAICIAALKAVGEWQD